ncbi:MAG: redoxin domain-containing protein [Bacilli bacterium]|nr:redoxin domain-containing protein [Bacilli bacterium]
MKKNTFCVAVLSTLLIGLTSCGGGSSSTISSMSSQGTLTSKELTLTYVDGNPVKNATIAVKDGTNIISTGKTNESGKYTFEGENKAYTLDVSGMKAGYFVEGDTTFPADKNEYSLGISSFVIYENMPRTKRYSNGDIMYDFEFETTKDEKLFLSDILQEKDVAVINFWATWCNPCMSEFQAFNDAYHGKGGDTSYLDAIEVITVNTDISLSQLKTYETTKPFFKDFTMTVDKGLASAFSVYSIPTTVFINKYGRVARISVGAETDYYAWRKYFDLFVEEQYAGLVTPYTGKALVETPDSGDLSAAACAEDFNCTFSAPSETFCKNVFNDSKYGQFIWPFVVSDDGDSIQASNTGFGSTFAMTIITCQLEVEKTLKVDAKISCEDYFDALEFYTVVNDGLGKYLGSTSGIQDEYQTIDLITPSKSGTYQIAILYSKDDFRSEGEDTAFIKNIRVEQKKGPAM